jgi:pimeloyl-[acyl-carrier protein] methyl ester esterase
MQKPIKPVIVLLPGWGINASIWQPVLESLAEYDIRQLDLPPLNQTTDFDQAMLGLINGIPDNSIIVAWSLSGLLALYLAHHLPRKCAKLILVSSLPQFTSTQDWLGVPLILAKQFQHKAKTNLIDLLNQFIKLVRYPDTSTATTEFITLHALNAEKYQPSLLRYLHVLFTVDYRQFFKDLTVPVHCIFGGKDAIVPSKAANQLRGLNKNTAISFIHDAGHIPFLTHQKIFNELLTGILHESA